MTSSQVGRRTIGPVGPSISQISYGTMRLRGTTAEAAQLLHDLAERGITTHHSSAEYDSHGLYLAALKAARIRAEHIVKLSSPSFDTDRFDCSNIKRAVHEELSTLGTDRLASVQWLFRTPDAQDLSGRQAALADQTEAIQACFAEMILTGDIADVSVFGYHPDFAKAALDVLPTSTMCDYLNLSETQNVPLLDRLDSFLAIRPLAGGGLIEGRSPEELAHALRWPLLHPKVSTIILSVNSPAHVEAAIAAAGSVMPDRDLFNQGIEA